jgi:hypothetical protein
MIKTNKAITKTDRKLEFRMGDRKDPRDTPTKGKDGSDARRHTKPARTAAKKKAPGAMGK